MFMAVFLFGINSNSMAKIQTLKAVSMSPKEHRVCKMIHVWVNRINKQCKDAIKINWVGAHEVIPGSKQVEALQNNTVQVIFSVAGYYSREAPEVNALRLSKLTLKEERKPGGFYDFMVKRHKKIGMMYIGKWFYDRYYLWIKKPVKKLEDLKGINVVVSSGNHPCFLTNLGMHSIGAPGSEFAEGLKRGVLQGFTSLSVGPRESGWLKHCKYIIDIPFYTYNDALILMNLDVWNRLGKSTQKRIMDITTEYESEMTAYFEKERQREWQKCSKMGVKKIKFTVPENKKFFNAAYDENCWKDLMRVEDLVPTLKKLTGN